MTDLVLDTWAALSHKTAAMGLPGQQRTGTAPTWVGEDNQRRLAAYRMLAAYLKNCARHFIAAPAAAKSERREYGDAALMIEQAVAALLGDDQTIVVDHADELDELLEDADAAEDPDADDKPDQAEAADITRRLAEAQRADEVQEWLRDWATTVRLPKKLLDAERKSVGLGDGVYVLSWSSAKRRPMLEVYDPGFYFPVLDSVHRGEDFPRRIHLAWEETRGDRTFVHRLTWQLAEIRGQVDDNGLPVLTKRTNADGSIDFRQAPVDGDVVLADGRIGRRYPWHAPDAEPSTVTCYMTEAEWEIGDITAGRTVDNLDVSRARYEVNEDGLPIRDLDLRIDFIPAVHIPNVGFDDEHFGESLLALVLQILDDIANTDTDLQKASALAGTPPLVFSNGAGAGGGQRTTVGPGQTFDAGAGTATFLDTSRNLDALLKLLPTYLKRLSENSRLAQALLGRIDGNDVPSGIALALSFGPTQSLIREMRLIRDEKYPLLLQFAARLAMAGLDETLKTGPFPTPRLLFGSYLPADRAAVVKDVTELLKAKAISRLTAVGMLVEVGFPIEDAVAEVEGIEHEDFEGAKELFDATGDDQAVRDYLGLESEAPTVDLPAPPAAE